MSELNDELSKRVEAALNAEIKRLWREAKGAATATTAVTYDRSAKAAQLSITFAEGTSKTEATALVQRFLQLCNESNPLRAIIINPNRVTKKRKRKIKLAADTALPRSLPEALHLATPDTVRLLTLIPMIREGLYSLECRLAVSYRECSKLLIMGTVSRELGIARNTLQEIKEVLDDLDPLIERFDIFDRLEAVLIDESASSWLVLAHDCLTIERKQDVRLGEVEMSLERLAS